MSPFKAPNRRGFLQVGYCGLLGLGLDEFFRMEARGVDTVVGRPSKEGKTHLVPDNHR